MANTKTPTHYAVPLLFAGIPAVAGLLALTLQNFSAGILYRDPFVHLKTNAAFSYLAIAIIFFMIASFKSGGFSAMPDRRTKLLFCLLHLANILIVAYLILAAWVIGLVIGS